MKESIKERQIKPKNLFIVEAMGGGVFTYIVDLANELVNYYDMYIAYAIRPQTPKDFQKYFDERIQLIEVKNFTRSISIRNDFEVFKELKKIKSEINPDIIHLHSSKAGVIGRWAFNGHEIPVFYTPHGYSFLMKDSNVIMRSVYRLIEFISAKRYCTTISCSKGEHEETLRLTHRAEYVDNGINVQKLQHMIDGIEYEKSNSLVVFTLGRICPQKNPVLFNKLALALPNVKFLWIGDGELRSELSAPNIEVTGWIERKEALKKSMSCNVFVLTSLWEGLPISLLEAMYLKKLCIVSNVIGNRDVIKSNVNGFIFNTVDDFRDIIHKYQDGKTEPMINRAFKDILERYNTSVMAHKYSYIYSNFLSSYEYLSTISDKQ